MTGAMYAAIGGLKTHMSNLNVIGNNIANVNTQAYKSQRMTFQESMYITSRAGSNGTVSQGGNNPSQVGYGAQVGSIDLNMSPGTFSPTGYDLDCMIDGEGFFLVGDKDTGDSVNSAQDLNVFELTRMGDFWVDPNGYVCDRRGKCVYGFAMVQNPEYAYNKEADQYIPSTQLVPLRLPLAAQADRTHNEAQWQVNDPVYGVLGIANVNNGNARRNYSIGDIVKACTDAVTARATTAEGEDNEELVVSYQITDDGVVPYVPGADGNVPENLASVTFTTQGGKPTGITGMTLPAGYNDATGFVAADAEGGPVPYNGPIPNGEDKCVELTGMGINKNGAIYGTNGNGQIVTIGYVAVANAAANDGVTHVDGYYYKAQEGAGDLRVSVPGGAMNHANGSPRYLNNKVAGTGDMDQANPPIDDAILGGGKTEIRNSGLEQSTADVATEFANMILTQRGYQANTRMITVTDSMLEELVNMKR